QKTSPAASVTAARWEGSRLLLCASRAPLPFFIRDGRVVRLSPAVDGERVAAACETAPGDILVVASSGCDRLRFEGAWRAPEQLLEGLAKHAGGQPLPAAFASAVSDWKKAGIAPGTADLLLLAARRLG